MKMRRQRFTYRIKRDISIIVKKHNFPSFATLKIILQREHKMTIKDHFILYFKKRMSICGIKQRHELSISIQI